MGVDAQMLVRIPRAVSDDELREWSYRFGSMAHYWLFLGVEDRVYHKPLERVDVYEQDGDDILPEPGETFLTVPLSGRYYGEGYERGNVLAYIAIAEFLEVLIPRCRIWYGGDSSGICAEPFDRTAREAFLRHAATHAHDPYVSGFDSLRASTDPQHPTCPVCAVAMPQCGFGGHGTYALFRCSGCGWEIQHKDGEVTGGFNYSERERRRSEKVPA